jgi:hypoxanthine phosphoribosyltransferase
MPDKIQYTNEQILHDLQGIVREIAAEGFQPDLIVGIARGGLVPATMLSHYFGVPLISLNLSLRDHMVDSQIDYATLRARLLMDQKILLVDDICDTGATFAKVIEELQSTKNKVDLSHMLNLRTVALWNNTGQTLFVPHYVGREIDKSKDDRWVIFPYEEWWKA